jgi:hypothetical protein
MLVCLSLNACSQHSEKECDFLLKEANNNLSQFYLSNDTTLLVMAKNYLDSIDCNSLKYKVFNSKTTLLILLKEYSEGIEYIKSLNSTDFNMSYQKNMYLKSFEAMQSKFKGDTATSNKLYKEIVVEIQSYLNNDDNQEILFDLFSFKSKIETNEQIIQEIELLRKTGKYDNDFLNRLIATMTDTNEVEGVAVPVNE